MKQLLFLISATCLLSSCTGWDQESKDSFKNSCVTDAKAQGMPEDSAKSMCECRLEKVMKKYPGVEDALEHMVEISKDPDIAACK